MMKSDIRRCRRCKRKRLDDEPMEVRQYKTCAKCRIIERNKKNLRKPLAKETMLYGLKQFREQQSTENYIEEEGLLKDEFFKRYHNKPFNYDAEIAKVMSDPNYEPPVITNPTDEIIESSDVTSPNGTRYQVTIRRDDMGSPTRTRLPRAEKIRKPRQAYKKGISNYNQLPPPLLFQEAQRPVVNEIPIVDKVDEKAELIGELLALGNGFNTENGQANPYRFANVYSNFEQYLQQILYLKSLKKNITNLVLLKEFTASFPQEMSKYHADASVGDRNSEDLALNERQSRMNLLSNLKALYVDPIIASTSLPFEQKSNNLHDFKYPSELRCYYQYRDVAEANLDKKELVNSSISLAYNKSYNILTIKFNLAITDKTIQYPDAVKDAVVNSLQRVNPKASVDGVDTPQLVFKELKASLDSFNDEVKSYMKDLTLEKFSEVFAAINGDLDTENGEKMDVEELEDEFGASDEEVEDIAEADDDDDDDEAEEDEDIDGEDVNATHEQSDLEALPEDETVVYESEVFNKSGSEVAAETLDPILKL